MITVMGRSAAGNEDREVFLRSKQPDLSVTLFLSGVLFLSEVLLGDPLRLPEPVRCLAAHPLHHLLDCGDVVRFDVYSFCHVISTSLLLV
mgnify:CR=1 FL=1